MGHWGTGPFDPPRGDSGGQVPETPLSLLPDGTLVTVTNVPSSHKRPSHTKAPPALRGWQGAQDGRSQRGEGPLLRAGLSNACIA